MVSKKVVLTNGGVITKVRSPQTNGFVERFNRTVLDECFRMKFRTTMYDSVQALQNDLDEWLTFYNTKRPHLGYRNNGKTPMETVMKFKDKSEKKEGWEYTSSIFNHTRKFWVIIPKFRYYYYTTNDYRMSI